MYWYLPWVWTLSFFDGLMAGGGELMATPLTLNDADAAAELHSDAFARPWSAEEFATLLGQEGSFGFAVRRVGHPDAPPAGFVLARNVADEAEILTIAVDKRLRGRGIGRQLMDAVLQHLYAERARCLFLEVDEENQPALKLYKRLRFEEVGRRPAYYSDRSGKRTSALVLRRDFA